MGKYLVLAFLVLGLAPATYGATHRTSPKSGGIDSNNLMTVYGNDDRKDLYELSGSAWDQAARSTVALFNNSKIAWDKSLLTKSGSLSSKKFGEERNLCKDEAFYDQPSDAFCSGSLVGPDLILTAGHCVQPKTVFVDQDGNAFPFPIGLPGREYKVEIRERCSETSFVFDYAVREKGVYPQAVEADKVYTCQKIIKYVVGADGTDWALVKLDRAVKDREPLKVSGTERFLRYYPFLTVIGHPSGLPTKVGFGTVRDLSPTNHFVASIDTFGGNSGSAVFNAVTGMIEGVLVRGEQDYYSSKDEGCSRVYKCKDNECNGEDVTKSAAFMSDLNEALKESTSPVLAADF